MSRSMCVIDVCFVFVVVLLLLLDHGIKFFMGPVYRGFYLNSIK